MKTIYKSLIAAAVLTPALTSCIEEVLPTDGVTQEQIKPDSEKDTDAILWGMPSYMNHFASVSSDYAYDWGYGSVMHIRDVMTEDYAVVSSSYDWYTAWEQCRNLGANMAATQFIWNLYTGLVQSTNLMIARIDEEKALEEENDDDLLYLGMGHAFRASHYLDMARMYEFLPNEKTSEINTEGKNVLNLTVPIVTEKTTEEQARNNPRATRQEMYEFILSDLQKAEEYIGYFHSSGDTKTLPDQSVIYGLYARLYMWMEMYPDAADYARKAINSFSGSITTEDEWLSTSRGFNNLEISSWMWGVQCMKEDRVVTSGILNWTSWSSNETTFGYAAAGPQSMINAATYDRINNNDFRKLSYKAPDGGALSGKEPFIDDEFAEFYLRDYASIKFRPGYGNMTSYITACATAYPLMRVEEMYLIEAEAIAHSDPASGASLLQTFMQYRCPGYTCRASGEEAVVEEIIFQKRVELWGEGLNYFDLKRLGYSVTRDYDGTNFYTAAAINTNGRPAWVNFCIVQTEGNNNEAVKDYNNPNPSDAYAN